jgi:perosamine synthetase
MITMADWKVSWQQISMVVNVLRSGRLTYGKYTRRFEEEFAKINGHKHALFTSSGTAALKIAINALKDKYGWQDGDEIIVPSVTFVATINAVLMNNLKPVIVDVNKYVNLDSELIEDYLTRRTKAIIAVHLLGQPADMKPILDIAKRHELQIIEDSCETMFIPTTSRGTVTCYSTYVAHLLVTGVGGLICTNDEKLAKTMRSMMFHGRDESYLDMDDKPQNIEKRFWFPRFGYSDRMTEMEAALGLGGLNSWEKMIDKRQENAYYLYTQLFDLPIDFPVEDYNKHAFMFFPMIVKKRNKLMLYLEENGIATRTMMPLINQPLIKKYLNDRYPMAEYIYKHGLLIGCHQYLKKKDLDYVIKIIRSFYEKPSNW